MGKVVVLSGVSGSGKSTYIRERLGDAYVVSADHYFMRTGVYEFDASKLGDAHAQCFRMFTIQVQEGSTRGVIVVDNTNTTNVEIAPYMAGARAFGWDSEIITLMCETDAQVAACSQRNSHGVQLPIVLQQHKRIQARLIAPLPFGWMSTIVPVKF